MNETFEPYGPMMIRNGFLRNCGGEWINLAIIKGLEILERDSYTRKWSIFIVDKDEFCLGTLCTLDKKVGAQSYLDHLLKGGVIRFPRGIPVMAAN